MRDAPVSATCTAHARAFATMPGPQQPDSAVSVEVECGALRGTLTLPPSGGVRITVRAGTRDEVAMTPTEFEAAAGKGASKKWRHSIKLRHSERRGPQGQAAAALELWRGRAQSCAAHIQRCPLKIDRPGS